MTSYFCIPVPYDEKDIFFWYYKVLFSSDTTERLHTHIRRPTRSPRNNTKKKISVFIIGDWNAKVRSQEISGVTAKFGLGVQNEADKRLTEFCQENALVIANTLFQQYKKLYTCSSPDVNTKIRLIIFSAAKDGEALYSQQKQDWELTMAQIMNSLLPNSDLN